MTPIRTVLVGLLLATTTTAADKTTADRKGLDFFESKIRPVLVRHCYQCHSAKAAANKMLKGGLQVDTRSGIRKGGETGIRRVQTLSGNDVWNALQRRKWSPDLMSRALSRADVIKGITLVDARTQDLAAPGVLKSIVPEPQAVLFEYRDGLKATLLLLDGAVGNFTAAVRLDRRDQVLSTKFLLPPEPNVAYSACLAHHIENMIVTGRPGYPVERTLLVSGLLEAAHDSRVDGHRPQLTPQLAIRYHAPRQSHYCRT